MRGIKKGFIVGLMGVLMLGLLNFGSVLPAVAQKTEITVAIHESPWLPAFKELISMYEKATGNKVNLLTYPHPTLYEKQIVTAVHGGSTYDVMNLDDAWVPFFMGYRYATPLKEIDPDFELDTQIMEYRYSTRWSHEKNYSTADGILYGIPVNGNQQLYFYRGDKFQEAGLPTPPQTWEDVTESARKLHNPPQLYGYATITVAPIQASYFWFPILRGMGGDILVNPPEGDWTVRINDEKILRSRNWKCLAV